jgi:hypothetical protein
MGLIFERNTPCNVHCSWWRQALFQIVLFSGVEETHASFERKLSVLETGASSTLFPWEN